jgi:hypothetical protein
MPEAGKIRKLENCRHQKTDMTQQQKTPILPVSEKKPWREIPYVIAAGIGFCEDLFGARPTLLLYEPIGSPNSPGYEPATSEAPEELIVVALTPQEREATVAALKRVEPLEPKFPDRPAPKPPKIKDNTPFKSIFRQMADMPATVLSFSLPPDSGELATIFFIRTAFTISQFRRELEQTLL